MMEMPTPCPTCDRVVELNDMNPLKLTPNTPKTARSPREARIDELTNFEPLARNHDACALPMSCVGYQNAASDFDNEKEYRLKELNNENNRKS